MRVKLICAGIHKNGLEVGEEELKQVAENFSQPVPITLGHPKSDSAPAVGFFEKVEFKNGCLYGEYKLSPLGQVLLASDAYRNVSVGLRRKPDGSWYLHHVALLGAVPPGSEDAEPLKIVNLSDEEGEDLFVETFFADQKPRYVSYAKTDYPVCLECEWDADQAKKRIVEKYGWQKLAECAGAVEVEEDGKLPESLSKYKFPYCDVVNGELRIVARAVSAGLAFLNGAMGVKIDPELERVVRPVFEKLRKKVEEAKAKKKEMSDKGGDEAMEKLKKELEAVKKKLAEEKIERLRELAEKKFSAEVAKEIVDFAKTLPMDFSQEETYVDKFAKILEKIPAPVKEGRMEFSNKEEEVPDADKALKAF